MICNTAELVAITIHMNTPTEIITGFEDLDELLVEQKKAGHCQTLDHWCRSFLAAAGSMDQNDAMAQQKLACVAESLAVATRFVRSLAPQKPQKSMRL